MGEAPCKFTAEVGSIFGVQHVRLHPGTKRKLVVVAAPIFYPAQIGRLVAVIGYSDGRNQNGIVAKGRENNLIDGVRLAGDDFSEISLALNTLEGLRAFAR